MKEKTLLNKATDKNWSKLNWNKNPEKATLDLIFRKYIETFNFVTFFYKQFEAGQHLWLLILIN